MTYHAISSWANLVQPGSPAPRSHRRRRSSISISIHHSTNPTSFLNFIDSPSTATPSIKDFHHDLSSQGYTSLFLRIPTTPGPKTAAPTLHFAINKAPLSPTAIANIPIPPIPISPKPHPLKRFPSLSALRTRRPRAKSLTMPAPPPSFKSHLTPTPALKPKPFQPKFNPLKPSKQPKQPAPVPTATAIAKHKKAKYPHTPHAHPPPLANQLALMQFADGGSIDSHVKRLMDAQARAAAGTGPPVGVGDVHRDGKGGIWWDQEEEWEYAHLLAGAAPRPATGWVRFGARAYAGPDDSDDGVGDGDDDDDGFEGARRGSVSTQASSLDARHVVRPSDEDALAAFGSCVPPRALRGRRLQLHQPPQQGRNEFLLAFVPRDAAHANSGAVAVANPAAHAAPERTSRTRRRRPAPLNLATSSPAGRSVARRPRSPVDPDKARRDFIEGSFAPPACPAHADAGCAERGAEGGAEKKEKEKGRARGRGMTLGGLFRRG